MEEEDKVEDWDGSDNDQQDGQTPLNTACTYKIIIVGDSNVGKTCLAWRFCSGQFLNKTAATIGVDFQEKSIELEGERIKLQVWDTAGQERFRKSMVQHYYRNVQAVIFCYDVTKLASFDALAIWLEEFDRYSTTGNIPRILVGNKCDCKSKKVVSSNMARKFADAHNMPLWETSAKDDKEQDTIRSIFLTLAHKLKYQRPLMPAKKDRYGNSKAGLDTISVQLEEPENGKKHRCSSCSSGGGSNKH